MHSPTQPFSYVSPRRWVRFFFGLSDLSFYLILPSCPRAFWRPTCSVFSASSLPSCYCSFLSPHILWVPSTSPRADTLTRLCPDSSAGLPPVVGSFTWSLSPRGDLCLQHAAPLFLGFMLRFPVKLRFLGWPRNTPFPPKATPNRHPSSAFL